MEKNDESISSRCRMPNSDDMVSKKCDPQSQVTSAQRKRVFDPIDERWVFVETPV